MQNQEEEELLSPMGEGALGGKRYQHEAFGMISLNRSSGSMYNLFGSHIKHSNFITLEISTAEYERGDTGTDYYFSRKHVASVMLSATQFSSMLTNMNTNGVPCTLSAIDGKYLKPVPNLESKAAQTKAEFKERMQEFAGRFQSQEDELVELIAKGKAGKGDLEKIKNLMAFFKQEINMNIPFFLQQFEKSMDKITVDAKGEIEAFVESSIRAKGLEAIQAEGGLNLGSANTDNVIELSPSQK